MHKIYPILFLIAIFQNVYSQNVNRSENEINSILEGKWNFEKIILDEEDPNLLKAFSKNSIEFSEDKQFVEHPKTEKSAKGFWNYNKEKMQIELYENGKIIGVIESLESGIMIYVPNLEKQSMTFFNTYKMHLRKNK